MSPFANQLISYRVTQIISFQLVTLKKLYCDTGWCQMPSAFWVHHHRGTETKSFWNIAIWNSLSYPMLTTIFWIFICNLQNLHFRCKSGACYIRKFGNETSTHIVKPLLSRFGKMNKIWANFETAITFFNT